MAAVKTRIWRGGLAEMLKSGDAPAAADAKPPSDPPTHTEAAPNDDAARAARSGTTQTFAVDKTRLNEPEKPILPPRSGATLLLSSSDLGLPPPDGSSARRHASTRILPIETLFAKGGLVAPQVAPVARPAPVGAQSERAPRMSSSTGASKPKGAWLQKLGRPVLYSVLVLGAAGSWYARLARDEAAAAPHAAVAPPALPQRGEAAHGAAPSMPEETTAPLAAAPTETAAAVPDDAPTQPEPSAREAPAVASVAAHKPAPPAARRVVPLQAKRMPRAAVDALAAGDYEKARRLYGELARAMPEQPAYAEALRILRERSDAID